MMDSFKRVLPHIIIDGQEELELPSGSLYIFGTLEERSKHSAGTVIGNECRFIFFKEIGEALATLDGNPEKIVDCANPQEILNALSLESGSIVYLDITGLSHDIWAPLLRVFIEKKCTVRVIYMEPHNYAVSPNPFGGDLFDLSEKITGIKPIPGFLNFLELDENNIAFVPLLGFEGARFAYIVENVQPSADKIIPVVGVPGFRFEYPFHTYQGNILTLSRTRSWKNTRYVTASSPFELYLLLENLLEEYGFLRIAPIGTKPHALGAILFAIKNHNSVEIIYDHPKRKGNRTSGIGKRHIYLISDFFGEAIGH